MTHRRDPVRRWRRRAAGSGATGRCSVGSATTVCWAPAERNPRSVFTFLKNEYIYRRFKLQLAPACGRRWGSREPCSARVGFGFCGYTSVRYRLMAYQNPWKHLHEYQIAKYWSTFTACSILTFLFYTNKIYLLYSWFADCPGY